MIPSFEPSSPNALPTVWKRSAGLSGTGQWLDEMVRKSFGDSDGRLTEVFRSSISNRLRRIVRFTFVITR